MTPVFTLITLKRPIILLLFMSCSVSTNQSLAQKGVLDLGIHTGIGMSRIYEPSNIKSDFYFRTIPDIGLRLSYNLSRYLSLGTELNYTSFSSEREGLLCLDGVFTRAAFPPGSYAYITERIDLEYVEVPMLVSGYMGHRLRFSFGVGPFLGFRLNARRISSGTSLIYTNISGSIVEQTPGQPPQSLDKVRNISGDIRVINLGGCERSSISYQLGKSKLWLEAFYSFGQTDIWRQGHSNTPGRTERLMLRAGYTFSL